MLSRSNSTAAARIRRAKSTSSTHTSASASASGQLGQQTATPATCDPFVSRQQAEAAAIEAYERARQSDAASARPVPPKLQRRRSQHNAKSQGSHFEEARRRSLVRMEDPAKARHPHPPLPTPPSPRPPPQQSSSTVPARESQEGERIITRRRSVIPPTSASGAPSVQLLSRSSSFSTSARPPRRRQSEYANGSPAPRHAQSVQDKKAIQQTPMLDTEHSDGYAGNVAHFREFRPRLDPRASTIYPVRPSIHETQTDEDIVALARDQCLQDFHTRKVRGRKSFILAPFQKRRPPASENSFDVVLPPFNHASSDFPALPPVSPQANLPDAGEDRRPRCNSSTLTGRLKNIFRKTSKCPAEIPAQQVQAKDRHFTAKIDDAGEAGVMARLEMRDPFVTVMAELPRAIPQTKYDSMNTHNTSDQASNSQSRVTSWTNSTVTGMSSIRTNDRTCDSGSHAALKHRSSREVLRKASTLFGKPIHNKLRRASKAELKGSEESQGLYTALQEHIKPVTDSTSVVEAAPIPVDVSESRTGSALATLPSQKQYSQSVASMGSRATSTIRAVTPVDLATIKVDVPSPVYEGMSPLNDADLDDTVVHHEPEPPKTTPQSGLKRRLAVQAQPPTREQLIRRMERTKDRWQTPLDELSPPVLRTTRAVLEDNPYELKSLSQSGPQPTIASGLPHHVRLQTEIQSTRPDVLSPSVYSRATDGASPRAITPEELGMTTITITGREVRRYSISPAKPTTEQRDHSSREWRRWLSGEMSHFGGNKVETPEQPAFPCREMPLPDEHSNFAGDRPQSTSRPRSISPAVYSKPEVHGSNSRRGSGSSGYMNERYPMINSSRASSRQSGRASRQTTVDPAGSIPDKQRRKASADKLKAGESLDHFSHVLRKTSIIQTEAERSQSALGTRRDQGLVHSWNCAEAKDSIRNPTLHASLVRAEEVARKPKSSHEAPIKYKNNPAKQPRSLPIHRKPLAANSLLEDNTIMDISAGPYASQRLPSGNQENRRPLDSPLPAFSSSEWLAAGARKPKEVKKASSMHQMARPEARPSPACNPQRSPGQRMVTDWLDERRSRESTPAFV